MDKTKEEFEERMIILKNELTQQKNQYNKVKRIIRQYGYTEELLDDYYTTKNNIYLCKKEIKILTNQFNNLPI